MNNVSKLIRIHPRDNILVVRSSILPGDKEQVGKEEICFDKEIALGHKIAAVFIASGSIIYKYGVPIGSAMEDILAGAHIHLHNMKSDYIATYTLDKEFIHEQQ